MTVNHFLSIAGFMLLLLLAASARADEPKPTPGQQAARTLAADVGQEMRRDYLLYLPRDYDKDRHRRWPLLLFLHGAGERGGDLSLVKKHGPPKLCEKMAYPFLARRARHCLKTLLGVWLNQPARASVRFPDVETVG